MAFDLTAWTQAGLSPSQLLRYAYAGLLATFLALVVEPQKTGPLLKDLGPVLGPLVALIVGLGLYVSYREIIGEFFLYPLRHLIHTGSGRLRNWIRGLRRRDKRPLGSFTAFLGELDVPFFYRRWVYRRLRTYEGVFDTTERGKLDILHSELHILYLTALETGAAAVYVHLHGADWLVFATIAAITMAAGFIVDIRQDGLETALLRTRTDQVKKVVAGLQFP